MWSLSLKYTQFVCTSEYKSSDKKITWSMNFNLPIPETIMELVLN